MNRYRHFSFIWLFMVLTMMGFSHTAMAENVIQVKPIIVDSLGKLEFDILVRTEKNQKAFQFDLDLPLFNNKYETIRVDSMKAGDGLRTGDNLLYRKLSNGKLRVLYWQSKAQSASNLEKTECQIHVYATYNAYYNIGRIINVHDVIFTDKDMNVTKAPDATSFLLTYYNKRLTMESIITSLTGYVPSFVCETITRVMAQNEDIADSIYYVDASKKTNVIDLTQIDSIGSAILPSETNQFVYCNAGSQTFKKMSTERGYNVVSVSKQYGTYSSPYVKLNANATDFDNITSFTLDHDIRSYVTELNRTFKARYATICLPVTLDSMSLDRLYQQQKVKFYKLRNVENKKANFTRVYNIESNKPYMIEFPSAGNNTLYKLGRQNLRKTPTDISEDSPILRSYATNGTNSYMQGTYTSSDMLNGYGFDENTGKFRRLSYGAATIYPFRAYIAGSAASSSKDAMLDTSFLDDEDDTVTAIEECTAETVNTGNGIRYNLQGQRVGSDAKGIIIVNNKKILVK